MTTDICNKSHAWHRVRCCLSTGLAMAAVVFMSFSPANAQTMDYGSLEQLFGEPVTTSATGSPQRVTEAPANMTIITADEIRRSGAHDISSVLRHVMGIDTMQWTAADTDISVRGYDQAFAARTLVLIDGRQVYADFYGFVPWSALPVELSAIRQIEIVRGPNAALFGFNAVGGVINIITYNPRYNDVNTASAIVGTPGLAGASGVATFKLGAAGAVRLSGSLLSGNEFATPIPPAVAALPRLENIQTKLNANFVFTLSNKIELDLDASHSHTWRNEMTPGYAYYNVMYETKSLLIRLTADTDFGLLKFTAYNNWLTQRSGYDPNLGLFAFHNRVTVVQGEDSFSLGPDHTVRLAAEYRYNTVNTAPMAGGDVFYDVLSASAMWNWRVTPSVSLTNAVRLDHLSLGRSGPVAAGYPFTNADWNRKIDAVSFNSGLVWKADELDTIRLTASRGVQLPSLINVGAFLIVTPYFGLTGIPTLEPTIVSNYEVAWDRDISSISARLRTSVFYQSSDDVVTGTGGFIITPLSFYVVPANIGSSQAEGIELSLSGFVGEEWRWSLGYRAELVDDRFLPFAAGGATFVDYQHTTPKHAVKAGLGWKQGDWEADAYLGYQSNTSGLRFAGFGTALVPVGAYVSLDGRLAYWLTDWATIAVSGKNLLQSTQRQTSGPDVERQVFATLSVNF